MAEKTAEGLTPPGQFYSFWQAITCPGSFAFWHNSSLSFGAKVNLRKARWGQLWNKNHGLQTRCDILQVKELQPTPIALSVDHMLVPPYAWELHTSYDEGIFIERRNIAARMVLKLLLEGSHGNCCISWLT